MIDDSQPTCTRPGWGLALLGYGLLTVVMTYPVAFSLFSMFPSSGDYFQDLWTFWFLRTEVLEGGSSAYFTDLLYHPGGVNLALHSLTLSNTAVGAILQQVGPPWFAFNVLFFASFVLAGLGAYFLVRYLTGHAMAAFVAGAIFTFSPFHYDLQHIKIVGIHWFPFFALFFLIGIKEKRWGYAVLAGVTFTIIGLDSWYYLVHAIILGFLMVVYRLVSTPSVFKDRRFWMILLLFTVTCTVTLLPSAMPVIRESLENSDDYQFVRAGKEAFRAVDLLGARYRNASWLLSWPTFFGYTTLLLGVCGVIFGLKRGAGLWFFLLLGIFSLALGTELRIGGQPIPGTGFLPYNLIEEIPLLNVGRAPKRILYLTSFVMAVLAGFGLKCILSRLSRQRVVIVSAASLLLVGAEMWQGPLPMQSPIQVSPFYEKIANDPEQYAIYDVGEDFLGLQMYLQTIHRKPLTQGYTSLTSQSTRSFVTHPSLSMLGDMRSTKVDQFSRDGVDHLRSGNVRYVIAQKKTVGSQAKSRKKVKSRGGSPGKRVRVLYAPLSLAWREIQQAKVASGEEEAVAQEYGARLVKYRSVLTRELGEAVFEDEWIVVWEIPGWGEAR